ncbi:MAG: ferredoxin [Spirochaetes bacterium GWF1_31_7]|nr:MAG: ferredoxin [Spirochaetes bacterium GWE1_32_154]OHD46962.1 MAG: ferredoxin [Spirochaetes bacterium GWF1_31_7]OHD49742.1 MAG: ferredoxin [Spirochaetes bacterium GWE2_31_10]OHD80123.1 MAG: ferredoxin [Spirochaetes bacterium RIFOXYB1_FULL_32_8]HBD95530.1 ferredoxin [Spirochaetia bacterium]
MEKPEKHIFVCASYRVTGAPQGVCHKKGSINLLQYLETEIDDRGLNVAFSSTGCLKMCDKGPILIVQPDNVWYGNVDSEKAIDEILDAVENNKTADTYVL